MKEEIKYRTYRTSINLFFFSFCERSKVYEIQDGKSTLFPGLKYSLFTLLFGWWSLKPAGWKSTLIALHINFSGGEDYTKMFSEMDYEEETVWVFNNVSRGVFEKINIETVDIIIALQAEFLGSGYEKTVEKNIIFTTGHLKQLGIVNLKNAELEEILSKIEQFKVRTL